MARVDQFGIIRKNEPIVKKDTIANQSSVKSIKNLEVLPQKKNEVSPVNKMKLFKPLKNLVPTSGFGNRIHPITGEFKYHAGIDYKAYYDPVYNIADGKVIRSGFNKISGKYLVIEHGKVSSVYCHLQEIYFATGDFIYGGEVIAKSGNTGSSTGPHLHFGLKYNGLNINPKLIKNQDFE